MEASAPKRRKTSPSTSVSVGGPDDASTPSDGGGAAARPRRPSFASPTRASLARTHPNLAEQRSRRPSQPPAASGDNGASEAASERGGLGRPRSPVRRAEGAGMDARPRRTPTKPSPRPLPPPSAAEEELLDPFKGRALRRSPPRGVLPARESQEPELPPTPTEKGLAGPAPASTAPLGIHRTPTKRPRRSRLLAERIKSSPLKEPPVRPAQPPLRPPAAARLSLAKIAPPVPRIPSATTPPLGQADATATIPRLQPARGVVASDPVAEKERLRSDLAAEVARLEADLDMAARENDRLHADAFNGNVSPEPSDQAGLIDLLLRHQASASPEPDSDDGEDWLEAALNPIGFLRFGSPSLALPRPSSNPVDTEEKKPAPIKSHHPVPLTAAEEMPFLQLFSPLLFTSTVALQPRTPENEDSRRPVQKHAIVATSQPAGLFAAMIEMTVDTKALAVTELSVPRLDPSAVAELGAFIQSITGAAANSALKHNVSVITWAMAEWTRLATQRARFWCRLQKELGTEKDLLQCASRLREDVRRKGAIGRRRANEDSDDDDEDAEAGGNPVADHPKTHLVAQMGRTNMDLRLGAAGGICLRIEWRITFDWTGEGQSHMCALVEAPAKWHHHDAGHSLTDIPEVFSKLIRAGRDPLLAVKTIVALVLANGKSGLAST